MATRQRVRSGFNKYMITIRETDGTENRVPAYGRDMQDALSRIVKRERTEKLVETTERIPDYIYVLMFLGTLGVGATLATADNPCILQWVPARWSCWWASIC